MHMLWTAVLPAGESAAAGRAKRLPIEDYDESDMEVLFGRGSWQSWDDGIDWLRREGMDDNELTPGETEHMKSDLEQLKKDNVEFTDDYRKAFQLAREHRRAA